MDYISGVFLGIIIGCVMGLFALLAAPAAQTTFKKYVIQKIAMLIINSEEFSEWMSGHWERREIFLRDEIRNHNREMNKKFFYFLEMQQPVDDIHNESKTIAFMKLDGSIKLIGSHDEDTLHKTYNDLDYVRFPAFDE